MYARNTDAQASPPLHIAAKPQTDAEAAAMQDLLGSDYLVYRITPTKRRPYQFQAETRLTKRRALEDLRGAKITELNYEIEYETESDWRAYVQFNPPAPEPAPIPVSHQIPACVGIAEPGTLAAQRGTPGYESCKRHVIARAASSAIVKAAAKNERRRQQSNKFNVWRHVNPTHSAWVRLPNMQRIECILDKRLIDNTWWYQVDISTDPGQKMLKWYREDVLEGVRRDKADRTMDVERRRYQNSVAGKVQSAIGQRVYIPTFDAGAGPARGCDYTITGVTTDGVAIRYADGSTWIKPIGEVYGELTHHARVQEGKVA